MRCVASAISSDATPTCPVSIMAFSFGCSERGTRPRRSVRWLSIQQMIQPLLEGFDPDRRLLLFYVDLTACRQARCSIAESSTVSCPAAIARVLRGVYLG